MSNIGIYKITSPTNKVYIGQSWDIANRVESYVNCKCKNQRKLYNSINKYGWDAHKFEVVLFVSGNVTQEMFDQIEQAYMDFYRSNGLELLNIREAGSRGRHSEETKRKMSEVQKNRPRSEAEIESLRQAGLNNLKRLHSPEARKKAAVSRIGHPVTEETRAKLSAAKKGKKYTPDKCVNMGRKTGSENGKSKAIVQLTKQGEFVREWPCMAEAARYYSISPSRISECCCKKPKSKSAAGFKWEFKPESN